MGRGKGEVSNTGNSVANYRWVIKRCDICMGTGKIQGSREEIRGYLAGRGLSFSERREIVKSRLIPCPDCEGRGEWEEWR